MIPDNITRDHVLKAIGDIKKGGVPEHRESVRYFLTHEGDNFPPKYVISLANKYANGAELDPSIFSGGNESNIFLERLGFDIMEESTSSSVNVWMEKTYWRGRTHKEEGELALGKALISPQRDRRGADIYRNMRLAKKGDLVLHLVDNKEIVGISQVSKEYDKTPDFTYDRNWDNQTGEDPGYLVSLEGFIFFKNPLNRSAILKENLRKELISILNSEGNVFYDKDLRLRQGAYFTAVPEKLMNLVNLIYKEKNGEDLLYWVGSVSSPRIALIGPTKGAYIVDILEEIRKKGQVYSTWSYSLSKEKIELLKRLKPFYLYCYITKSSRGSGLVEYRLRVRDFEFSESEILCPQPEHYPYERDRTGRGWYLFDGVEPIEPPRTLDSFEIFDEEKNLTQTLFARMRNPKSEFIYLKDVDVKGATSGMQEMGVFESMKALLERKKQIILYGPPGTGKTYVAMAFAKRFLGSSLEELRKKERINVITFHPSYSYEEFVEGITVNTDTAPEETGSAEIQYIRKWGMFKKICTLALARSMGVNLNSTKKSWVDQWDHIFQEYEERVKGKSPEDINDEIWKNAEKFVLVIDEINRGDVSKIFGELVTLLENDKRLAQENQLVAKLPYSNDRFAVPPNIYIIGTMNTADRSIALVDIALRRRFGFVEMAPQFEALRLEHIEKNKEKLEENNVYDLLEKSIDAVKKINGNIINDLGRDKQIGHSFFFEVFDQKDLMMAWQHEILPLLEEYYYCDYNKILRTLSLKADNPYINKDEGIKGFKKVEDLDDFLTSILS